MPDFSSTCLWAMPGGDMIYPKDIGLSERIAKALMAFEWFYDDIATGRPSYLVLKQHENCLNKMGLKIAEDIKAERPDLNVWYWGDYANGKIKKVRIPKARSSVGTEHPAYTRKVGSSNLPVPTTKRRGH